jgi:hypothetical protein
VPSYVSRYTIEHNMQAAYRQGAPWRARLGEGVGALVAPGVAGAYAGRLKGSLDWLYNRVRKGGPWDYKQADHEFRASARLSEVLLSLSAQRSRLPCADGEATWVMLCGTRNRYADFGNFHYGAVCYAFGISRESALRMAGYAQQAATGVGSFPGDPGGDKVQIMLGLGKGIPPYGDDPEDQVMIGKGYDWARQHFRPR